MIYRHLLRPALFSVAGRDAEAIHERVLGMLARVSESPGLTRGLARFAALAWLGFGFIEIGTITQQAQPGNPRPRLFRLPSDQALINRMGFNNDGADAIARRLARQPDATVPLGISLGKSKMTPLEDAVSDYL